MIFKFKEIITKIDAGIVKIPTLVGMGVLLIGLAGGAFLVTQNQTLKSKAAVTSSPKNINIVNLNSNSASIYWQTDETTSGFIRAGIGTQEKQLYRDDRDLSSPELHKLHFVTLTNLQPETTYYYQIYSGAITYPIEPLNFKTSAVTPNLSWLPLVGTIIDANNQTIDEAIVTLNLPEAQKLATVTKANGNFILPISDIKTADLVNPLPINKVYTAKLDILGTSKNAQATVLLPTQSTLPPIILGSNVDLTQTVPKISSLSAEINKYDINGDGIVNYTDLSIILQNFGSINSESKNPKTDLNGDGVVNQKDANLLIPYLK